MKIIKMLSISLVPILALLLMQLPGTGSEPKGKEKRTPNLIVDVSATLIDRVVQRPVDRTEDVQETIQDIPICGRARTLASVWPELVPDPDHATLDLILQGNVFARSTGQQRTILIHTQTTTQLDVRRRIAFDGEGIRVFAGTCRAQSCTELLDICSTMDMDALSICLAHRIYPQRKHASEIETAYKTARRVSHELEEQLAPKLAAVSKSIGGQLNKWKRAGFTVASLDFSTTATALQARLHLATPGQRKPSAVPALPAGTDLGVRIHESLVNEAARLEFGGKSFTLDGVSRFYDNVTRGLLRDGRSDGDQKDSLKKIEKLLAELTGQPVTITLAAKDPITVAFTEQGFSIDIHIASIRRESDSYAGGHVKAAYKLLNSKNGVRAVRQGAIKVEVEPAKPEKKLAALPAQSLLLKEVLFNEVLKEQLTLSPMTLPDAMAEVRMRAPRVDARQGWLLLAWPLADSK